MAKKKAAKKKATKNGAVRKTARRARRRSAIRVSGLSGVGIAAMVVDENSSLAKPQLFSVDVGGMALWIIGNEFDGEVNVRIPNDYKYKDDGKPVKGVIKFKPDNITLAGKGDFGVLYGKVTHKLRKPKVADDIKYDIIVTIDGNEDRYDPDLEVTPPPEVVPPRGGVRNPLGITPRHR